MDNKENNFLPKSDKKKSDKRERNKKRQLNNFAAYFYKPFVLVAIIMIIVSAVVLPNLNFLKKAVGIFTVNPSTTSESNEILLYSGESQQSIDVNSIAFPNFGDKYGVITCDELGLNAPVFLGDSNAQLKYGVGQYNGSLLPGFGKTTLIAGHNSTYFLPLKDVAVGQNITCTTTYGKFDYTVTEIKVKSSTATDSFDLKASGEKLVLYTCYPFEKLAGTNSERLFVYCEKVTGPVVTGVID